MPTQNELGSDLDLEEVGEFEDEPTADTVTSEDTGTVVLATVVYTILMILLGFAMGHCGR